MGLLLVLFYIAQDEIKLTDVTIMISGTVDRRNPFTQYLVRFQKKSYNPKTVSIVILVRILN